MKTDSWTHCGSITLDNSGRPVFPKVASVPGIYRLTLGDGWCYIGETKDLGHRFWEYCHPTSGVISEHRINEAIKKARSGEVEIIVGNQFADKPTRCMVEANEIGTARSKGKKLLNGGGAGELYCISLDIKYHEDQIAKLRHKLKSVPPEKE